MKYAVIICVFCACVVTISTAIKVHGWAAETRRTDRLDGLRYKRGTGNTLIVTNADGTPASAGQMVRIVDSLNTISGAR